MKGIFNINDKFGRIEFLVSEIVLLLSFGFMIGFVRSLDNPIGNAVGLFFFIVVVFLTCVPITVFRLNDIGWNRWLFLLNFVPYVNVLFFIVILFARGRE